MNIVAVGRWEIRGFPISRDPPEGGTINSPSLIGRYYKEFPISRDPPEGGTNHLDWWSGYSTVSKFPISRDPPEGGTSIRQLQKVRLTCFQFLGIPPKGEHYIIGTAYSVAADYPVSNF